MESSQKLATRSKSVENHFHTIFIIWWVEMEKSCLVYSNFCRVRFVLGILKFHINKFNTVSSSSGNHFFLILHLKKDTFFLWQQWLEVVFIVIRIMHFSCLGNRIAVIKVTFSNLMCEQTSSRIILVSLEFKSSLLYLNNVSDFFLKK